MYISSFFQDVPEALREAEPEATREELEFARVIRRKFQQPGEKDYGLYDVVRGFRILKHAQTYVEVGSRDKGNVAYAHALMPESAISVEIDIEKYPRELDILQSGLRRPKNSISITLREIDAYLPLVRPGGVLFIHDCYYEGNAQTKGKSQALINVDRFVPVYAIYGSEPIHRVHPRALNAPAWGGLAAIVKPPAT
jgi:hypothetical protein